MYGQLPSYVKNNATVFDIKVTHAILSWEKKQYDAANGVKQVPKLDEKEMLAMIKRARGQQ